ncbi:MAG: SUMF1/EgtB/PvdO family nonheme iron enzyme [Syntrophotaleaceae bacterium]
MDIPGYSIERELGQGGMSTVFLARQESMGRQVALKVMVPALAADRTFGARFLQEARTVGQLIHPHILAAYDFGAVGPSYYLAMEYLPGGDLKQRLEKGTLPVNEAFSILKQVAGALGYAHGKGFVHRDVKPENVLFREDGTVVLSDFGIAKAIGGGSQMTAINMSVGTPPYMSPEQVRSHELDGRSDLYSLGILFYEMLFGEVPYQATDSFAIGMMHINAPLPSLPDQFSWLQTFLDRLLAKDPEGRFKNAEEVISAIDTLQQDENRNNKPVIPVPHTKINSISGKKHLLQNLQWVGWGGLLAVMVIGSVWFLQHGSSPRKFRGGGGGGALANTNRTETVHRSKGPLAPVAGEAPVPAPVEPFREATSHSRDGDASPPITAGKSLSTAENASRAENHTGERVLGNNDPNQLDDGLAKARHYLEENRFLSEDGENAFHQYLMVLTKDPENREGQNGLRIIGETLLKMLDKAENQESCKKVSEALEKLRILAEKNPVVASLWQTLEAAKVKKVGTLLDKARKNIEVQKYMVPPEDNAYEKLGKIIALDPRNVPAKAEMRRIAEKYLQMAQTAGSAGKFDESREYLEKVETIDAGLPQLSQVRQDLLSEQQEREQKVLKILAEAKDAMAAGAKSSALASINKALGLYPGHIQATKLKRQASQIMAPGETFRDKFEDGSMGPALVVVAAGSFRMGDLGGRGTGDEKPVHQVKFSRSFAVGQYEVSFAEYDRFCRATGRTLPDDRGRGRDRHPVANVSWEDAMAYTAWLTKMTGHRYRLPTEAEWEYVARAGTGTLFWWGENGDRSCSHENILDQAAKDVLGRLDSASCRDNQIYAAPVGSFKANGFGLYDMLGNVGEWCRDSWHADYHQAPGDGRAWTAPDSPFKVVRGGSWSSDPKTSRSAERLALKSTLSRENVGFRLVRELD